MAVAKVMTRCPFCKEPVVSGASICKHCRSELPVEKKGRFRPFSRLNTFRTGFLSGVVFALILVILFHYHFN